MSKSNKFVIKCGNFAVLVDLHALPLGCRKDTSWFSQELKEEVSALIREVVDQRVKQFLETQRQPQLKGLQAKQRRELSPASPLCVKGPTFRLAAYFMKRHVNLRCIAKQRHRELRVFPERFVACVSRPEDAAAARGGNVTRSMEEQGGQSCSEYFSGRGETLDPLNSSAITKRTALQKIAKQASAQVDPRNPNPLNKNYGKPEEEEAPGPSSSSAVVPPPLSGPGDVGGRAVAGGLLGGTVASSTGACLEGGEGEALAPRSEPSEPRNERSGTTSRKVAANPQQQESKSGPTTTTTAATTTTTTTTTTSVPPQAQPCVGEDNSSSSSSSNNSGSGRSRRRAVRLPEGLLTQDAKRLRRPSEPTTEVQQQQQQPDGSGRASPRSSVPGPSPCSPPPPPPSPPPRLERALEAEQEAAHGKQSGRLPLRVGNAEQTNSSRLAASLRGLSVKPVSSGSSIGSRLAAKEEKEGEKEERGEEEEAEGGRQSTARTSRLRRPKKS